jgi:hypothetical protein
MLKVLNLIANSNISFLKYQIYHQYSLKPLQMKKVAGKVKTNKPYIYLKRLQINVLKTEVGHNIQHSNEVTTNLLINQVGQSPHSLLHKMF